MKMPYAEIQRSRSGGKRRAWLIAGTLLLVIAEASSIGLLSLSGWFIASSAAAGLGLILDFSFAEPSGGVRGFAVGRVAANYGQRMLLHRVALDDLAALRLRLLANSGLRDAMRLRDGEALDRVMSDADIVSRRWIEAIAPWAAHVLVSGGAIIAAWIALPPVALPLAIGVVLSFAIAVVSPPRRDALADTYREKMRGELVAAVDAHPELAALDAVDILRDRTAALLAQDTATKNQWRRQLARREWLAAVLGALVLGSVALVTALSHTPAPIAALVLLLTLAVMESSSRLVDYASNLAVARGAEARLASPAAVAPPSNPQDVTLVNSVQAGETLLLTGPSGIGKSTLLRRLAQAAPIHATLVELDDPIFTGTVLSNLRLGAPELSEAQARELLNAFALGDLALNDLAGVDGRALSGGESTRLRLARAVAASPALLLVDEPTTGLDAATAQLALAAVRHYLPQARIIYALHKASVLPTAREHALDQRETGSDLSLKRAIQY